MYQRLYEITMLLTQKGMAIADELAGRFEMSKRTIYRDIDAPSAGPVPHRTEEARTVDPYRIVFRGQGWYLQPV